MGRFRTAIDPKRELSYVAFAAGSGITPVLSLATDILAREPRSRFTLIYGNRSISRTMFLEETLALKNRYIDRFAVHFVMSREPQHTEWLNGRIDGHKVASWRGTCPRSATADEYLICGPGDMVDEVRNAIKALNGNAPIRFERFAGDRDHVAASPHRPAPTPAGRRTSPPPRPSSTGHHLRGHGRPAPQLPDGAERCVGARCRGTRGPRAAVLLPLRHLCDLPRSNHATAPRS